MDVKGLRDLLISVCEEFFNGTSVIWAGEGAESPALPFVILRTDTLNKATFPFDDGFNDEGQYIEYYNADIMFEVKAYTRGCVSNAEVGTIQTADNTAINDLQQFVDYILSQGMIEQLARDNVQMSQEGPVRDTSIVKSGSKYEYSAMVEYKVNFILESTGVYSASHEIEENSLVQTTPVGIDEETGYFDTVNKIEREIQ